MKRGNLLQDILVIIRSLDEYKKLPNSEKNMLDQEIQMLFSLQEYKLMTLSS